MKLTLLYPTNPGIYKGKPFMHIHQKFGENAVALYKQLGLNGHNGWDIFATDGYPVYAAHDGKVTFAGEDGAGGLTLVIRTTEKFEYDTGEYFFKTIYCHLKKNSFLVKPGEIVVTGQLVAETDNTGASTNAHLHFGLNPVYPGEQDWQWYNLEANNGYNGAIDPEPYIYLKEEKFTQSLKQGDRNGEVVKLQLFLQKLGFFTYPDITGFYGVETSRAVLYFQIKYIELSWYERVVLQGKKWGPKSIKFANTL